MNSAYVEWRRRQRGGLKTSQESCVPLWERTGRFRIYESAVIPGPLQTAGYTTALMQAIIGFNRIPNDLQAAVQARRERQRPVHASGRTFAVVIGEQVLRTRYGDMAAMAEQLEHLLSVTTWPNVSFGIVPSRAVRSEMWQLNGYWIYDSERVITELLTAEVTVTQRSESKSTSAPSKYCPLWPLMAKKVARLSVMPSPSWDYLSAILCILLVVCGCAESSSDMHRPTMSGEPLHSEDVWGSP